MADVKISGLPASSTPLAGTEVLPIVQSTTTKQVSVNNLTAGRTFDALGMTLTSTDAGASAAPTIDLYRDSASPAASDTIGEIEFNGKDSAGNKQAYALFHGSILSATSGAEQGQIHFETATAGALTEKMIIGTGQLVINDIGADFDVRIEGDNDANLFYADASTDRIGIGTASPASKFNVYDATSSSLLVAGDSATSIISSRYSTDTTNPFITLRKARGTVASPAAVQTGDNAGAITFSAYGGSNFRSTAIIQSQVSDYTSDTNISGNLVFSVNNASTGASAEAMRINSIGKVLVGTSIARANFFNGTSSPLVQVEGTTFDTSSYSAVRNSNDTSAPFLVLAKSRGTTVGSNTIVNSGDQVGAISFQGNDGTEFVDTARITAAIDGTPGANDMPGRLMFFTTADGASALTERMRIDSSGNVGIGATSFGTSAERVLSIGSGVEPSSGPADTAQLYSVDLTAGNTILGLYCEGTGVTGAGITSTAVTTKIAIKVNGTVYYLLATTNGT